MSACAHFLLQVLVSAFQKPTRTNKLVILLLSGALSPVHRGHLALLTETAAFVNSKLDHQDREQRRGFNGECEVVAGVLAPSSDAYVRRKLGSEALPFETRCSLCDASIADEEFVTSGGLPLVTSRKGEPVATRLAESLHDEIAALWPRSSDGNTEALPNFEVIPIFGSDFYVRYPQVCLEATWIVGRDDAERTAERALATFDCNEFDFTPAPLFMMLTLPQVRNGSGSILPDFSSSSVRQILKMRGEKSLEEVRRLLVPMLSNSVIDVMLAM